MVYTGVKTQVPEPAAMANYIRMPSGLLDLIDAAAKPSGRSLYVDRLACYENLGQVRENEAHPSINE